MAAPDDPTLPRDAWDCHVHVFGPGDRFPYAEGRTYTPEDAPYEALAALHRRLGFGHAVIVQGACHGTDHAALLDALQRGEGRHRGIALLKEDVDAGELERLHAAGVRGARFNFVGHLGAAPAARTVQSVAERIAPFGWHLCLHVQAGALEALEPLLANLPIPFVIDHMGRIDVSRGLGDAGFQRLLALGSNPLAWIKVSAFDRACGGRPPYEAAVPFAAALLRAYAGRALWGTDWPHPNIAGDLPDEAGLLRALFQACAGDDTSWHRVLVQNPRLLYGP